MNASSFSRAGLGVGSRSGGAFGLWELWTETRRGAEPSPALLPVPCCDILGRDGNK